ncbi:unnamed protein product [Dracunculus medinensis]|uniref:Uncharacterized protein n=1 Tax=Dracunculus medinensis TaxID=318479 RepID=A0A158Q363_DRAME|nr:unnamed protein product [Dracunculus medinensis]
MSGCVSGVVIVAPCVDHFIEVQDDGAAGVVEEEKDAKQHQQAYTTTITSITLTHRLLSTLSRPPLVYHSEDASGEHREKNRQREPVKFHVNANLFGIESETHDERYNSWKDGLRIQ